MRTSRRSLALAVVPMLAITGLLRAQESDQRWLDHCQENRNHRRATHCAVQVFELTPRTSLTIDAGTNGGIHVESWDQAGIEVHARIQAWDRDLDEARNAARRIRIDSTGPVLQADGPEMDDGSWSVSFVVYVPRRMDLEATAHNGPVSVEDVVGKMNLSVVNGPLALEDLGGDVRARAQNGPLHVRLSGTSWEGRGLDAETANGPVALEIPEDYSAELETGTVNGPMNVEFPLTVTLQGRMPRRIRTTLGQGGATVRAVTTNGPASIERP
jgi:DUF4097 and DUF4098 domain-containing protein YvlB